MHRASGVLVNPPEPSDDYYRQMQIPLALQRLAIVATVALPCAVAAAEKSLVHLCADHWMPYNGAPDDTRPGYVVELARAVFVPRGVQVDYQVLPWDDALVAVREGRLQGVIGAGKEEAEGMVLPAEPIGAPQVCLMTLATSTWSYESIASFRNARLGVIKDYTYWPTLDSFIERKAGNGVLVVEGETPLDDLMAKLKGGEIDVLAEYEPVILWHLRVLNLDRSQFRVVYKHQADPIYVAFAPSDDGRRYATMLDEGVRSMRASGELEKLLRRYGLADWVQAAAK
jgi:polar amino acid transport system substrate-binding protein